MRRKKLARAAAIFGARPEPADGAEGSAAAGEETGGGVAEPGAGSGEGEDGTVGSDIDVCDDVKLTVEVSIYRCGVGDYRRRNNFNIYVGKMADYTEFVLSSCFWQGFTPGISR